MQTFFVSSSVSLTMDGCDHCGKRTVNPFHCRYCGGYYCGDHRLPCSHNCIGESVWQNTPSPHSVDFTRLGNGQVKVSHGKDRSGSYAPVMRGASGDSHPPMHGMAKPSSKSIDTKMVLMVFLVLLAVAIIILLIT